MSERKFIPVCTPLIGEEEKAYVRDCLDSNWVSQGKYLKLFEEQFSAYCGCKYGVAANNGTTALHLAGIAIGLQPGDEVLVSSSTNMASAFSMHYCGARPVPVDIELDTWQMDTRQLERLITPRTKAIMVVHLFWHPVDMDPVIRTAKTHGLKIIEDCAEAHGAEYKGQRVGSLGDIGCFSFYANKIITTGEGGMVVTNSGDLADKVRDYGNFCYGKVQKFMHEGIGYNYRMSNINAAVGLGQCQRLDAILQRKQYIYERYRRNLEGTPGFHIPTIRPWAKSVMWMFNAHVDSPYKLTRDELMQELRGRGVETREAFVPLNRQKIFREQGLVKEDDCPVANYIMDHGFYLPSGISLTDDEIDYVSELVRKLGK
jgi:perosamine synthetase